MKEIIEQVEDDTLIAESLPETIYAVLREMTYAEKDEPENN